MFKNEHEDGEQKPSLYLQQSPTKNKIKKLTIIGEQEEDLRCEDDDSAGDSDGSDDKSPGLFTDAIIQQQDRANEEQQDDDSNKAALNNDYAFGESSSPMLQPGMSEAQIKKQKRHKSKQIKKILKQRLNIDCLRMLCEDSPAENGEDSSPGGMQKGQAAPESHTNPNDSYHVLMREIGIDNNDGLSHAFLQKNGEAQREELNSFTEMFSVRDLLGVGAFGVVLMVKNRMTKEKSALKIIAKERLSARAQKILKNESTIMQTMDHESVVSLKRIFENSKFIILEMELIPGGQLKRLFKLKDKAGKPKPLTDYEASQVMLSLLKGVAYVHARDIIHRDLKPENILLVDTSEDCQDVKIVDFGLSAEQNWRSNHSERAGTPIYMAPEQITGKGYSKKVDLWACGIIVYQLLACGQHPCYTPGEVNYYKKLQNIESKPIEWKFPANFTPLAKDFFLNLCAYPPSQRYDAATALTHPWLTRNDNDEIPLNQQQEFAMFQREHQLRKVMRLVYFASHVEMHQNALKATCKSSEDFKAIEKGQKTPSLIDHENKDKLAATGDMKTNTIAFTYGYGLKSKSPTKPRRSLQIQQEVARFKALNESAGEEQQKASDQQRYKHDTFLKQSNFAQYKELLLREVSVSQKTGQLEESTSAESPSRLGESLSKNGGRGKLSEDQHSLDNNQSVDNEFQSMPIKPRTFNKETKSSASNSPTKRKGRKSNAVNTAKMINSGLAANNKLISPIHLNQQEGAAQTGQNFAPNKQNSNGNLANEYAYPDALRDAQEQAAYASTGFVAVRSQGLTAAAPPPPSSENAYQQMQRRLTKQGSNLSSSEQPLQHQAPMSQSNYLNKSAQKPGRNLVHVRSPIHNNNNGAGNSLKGNDYDTSAFHHNNSQRDSAGGNSAEAINTMGTNGSAGYASRKAKFVAKNGGKVGINSIEATSTLNDSMGVTRKSKFSLYQAQEVAQSKAEVQSQNRKKLQSTNYPIVKDILKQGKDSSNKLSNENNQLLALQQQNLQFTMEPASPDELVTFNRNMATTNPFECLTPEATTEVGGFTREPSLEKNIGCEMHALNQHKYDNDSQFERLQQSSQKNLQPVKQKSTSMKKSAVNRMQQYNSSATGQDGSNAPIVSKSSKKRSTKKSKTVNIGTNEFSSNTGTGRVLQQQATFEVQSTKLTFMKGHQKESLKMTPGIDTKIDWLQMAKDEKTMAGSKLLQEQLSKAQPTYELNGEQLRSSRTHILQEGGFKKQSQPTMIYQPPIAENVGSRTQYKSFKGSRQKTKSPLIQHQKMVNQANFAQSQYQVDGKPHYGTSQNFGSFNMHGVSPSQNDIVSAFGSQEHQKRSSNPYNLTGGGNSGNSPSPTKKKRKSSAQKKAAKQMLGAGGEQNPFALSPTLPNNSGSLRNCISSTSAEEPMMTGSMNNRVSSNNLQMGGTVQQSGLPWPQTNNQYYTTQSSSNAVGNQNFSSVYKRNEKQARDEQEQHLVALLTPAPKRSKPLQKITINSGGATVSPVLPGNSHSIVASTGSVGSSQGIGVGGGLVPNASISHQKHSHHQKNSNSFDNSWGSAAIDTQLRLDRANRAAIEASGGVLPLQRNQNQLPKQQTDINHPSEFRIVDGNSGGQSVMVKRRSATQANRIAQLDQQTAAMAIHDTQFRQMQQATPQPLDQQQAYVAAPVTQIAPFQARQKRPKSKNRVAQVMTSQEFYKDKLTTTSGEGRNSFGETQPFESQYKNENQYQQQVKTED